jgi:antirestriction protein ArdC
MNTYEKVNAKIIQALDNNHIPWHKPWNMIDNSPRNAVTGHKYTGCNIWLCFAQSERVSPYFLTWNQIQDLNAQVIEGSSGTLITYSNYIDFEDGITISEDEISVNKTKRFFLRYYYVYNILDCTGEKIVSLKSKLDAQAGLPIKKQPLNERMLMFVNSIPNLCNILNVDYGNKAFYNPAKDEITVPVIDRFDSIEDYCSTLIHELAHSTGHFTRCNRFGENFTRRDDEQYSFEEIVAEMTTCYIMAHLDFENDKIFDNSLSYIYWWKQQLAKNQKFFVNASAAAQKAAKYLLNNND